MISTPKQISLQQPLKPFIADVHLPKTSWKAVPQTLTDFTSWSNTVTLIIVCQKCYRFQVNTKLSPSIHWHAQITIICPLKLDRLTSKAFYKAFIGHMLALFVSRFYQRCNRL